MKRSVLILLSVLLAVTAVFVLTSCGESETVDITFSVNGVETVVAVKRGEMPVFSGSTEKAPDAENTYEFAGWSPALAPATEPVTYTATYTSEPRTSYTIRFVLRDETITVHCLKGEIPTPPATPEIVTKGQTFTFENWDKEIAPATEDALYRANYKITNHPFEITFRIGNDEVKRTLLFGDKITYDVTIPTVPGKEFFWDHDMTTVTDNETFYGCYADPSYAMTLKDALGYDLAAYSGENDNQNGGFTNTAAFLYLMLEEQRNPGVNEAVTLRAKAHLVNVLSGGKEPRLNAEPYWSYALLSAAIAVAKETPTVWNTLTAEQVERTDCFMRALTVLTAFSTDDDNDFYTGPALTGNYKKGWNPNYRLANVTPIIFCTRYLGGAQTVNDLLLNFSYDAYMAEFNKYGFTRIAACWGTKDTNKKLMEEGGTAYLLDGSAAGSGVGVRTTYTYNGHGLDDLSGIYNELLAFCYSGGAVVSDSRNMARGLDDEGNPRAYILDGSKSPYERLDGMMMEFCGGDSKGFRSSLAYTTHDFDMVVGTLFALRQLGMWSEADNETLFSKVAVGNADVIYKAEKGYRSFSLGEGYDSHEESYGGYMLWKSLWNTNFGDYDFSGLTPIPEPTQSAGSQDFEGKPGLSMRGNEGRCTETIIDENGNKVLQIKGDRKWLQIFIADFFKNAEIGKTYKLTFRYKIVSLQPGATGGFSICNGNFSSRNGDGASTVQASFTELVTGEWAELSCVFVYKPSDAANTALDITVSGCGHDNNADVAPYEILFDDFVMEETEPEGPKNAGEQDFDGKTLPGFSIRGVEADSKSRQEVLTEEDGNKVWRVIGDRPYLQVLMSGFFNGATAGKTYTLTFRYKVVNLQEGAEGGINIYNGDFSGRNPDKELGQITAEETTVGEWKTKTVTFTYDPTNTAYTALAFKIWGCGSDKSADAVPYEILFDDFVLTETEAAQETPGTTENA